MICAACRASRRALVQVAGEAAAQLSSPRASTSPIGYPASRATASARRASPAASAYRPMFPQRPRPAAQAIGQRPGRTPAGDSIPERGEMAQRPGQIAENSAASRARTGGAPVVTPRLGAPGDLAQQRVMARQPAAQEPPPAPARPPAAARAGSCVHGPGQHLPHGRVLGVQPPGRGQLPLGAVCSPAAACSATCTAHPASAAAAVLLTGLASSPVP